MAKIILFKKWSEGSISRTFVDQFVLVFLVIQSEMSIVVQYALVDSLIYFHGWGMKMRVIAVISKLSRLSSDAQPSRRRNVDECFGHMTCLATGGQLH